MLSALVFVVLFAGPMTGRYTLPITVAAGAVVARDGQPLFCGDAIADRIEKALGIKFGETTADGRVTLEAVYCLGLCATAPSAMLDDRLFGRLNAAKADRLTAEAQL